MTLQSGQSTVGVPQSELDKLKSTPNAEQLNSGLFNTSVVEAVPNFNQTEAETVYQGKHNSYIVMGRDRPRDIQSGYGGVGVTQCGTIDLVVGLGGKTGIEVNEQNQSVYTAKSPELDSARIYISQRTDVDDNFILPDGKVGNSRNKSAVAVKADAVRLIARDGIKLVTGTDVYDGANGVRIDIQEGIDLIAGKWEAGLQPLVKGDNLVTALKQLVDLVSDVNGNLTTLYTMYCQLVIALSVHTHIATIPGGPVTPSPDFAFTAIPQFGQLATLGLNLGLHGKNCGGHKVTYLEAPGSGYINSIFNTTN
tara:strand:+ start:1894 stop:2820 length:927 start_codon:yes stop_codon:yes gene_type:complete